LQLLSYEERSLSQGADSQAAAFVEMQLAGGPATFGAGIDPSIVTAPILAIVNAANRCLAAADAGQRDRLLAALDAVAAQQ
jgi:2-isopropylmalate synthase